MAPQITMAKSAALYAGEAPIPKKDSKNILGLM